MKLSELSGGMNKYKAFAVRHFFWGEFFVGGFVGAEGEFLGRVNITWLIDFQEKIDKSWKLRIIHDSVVLCSRSIYLKWKKAQTQGSGAVEVGCREGGTREEGGGGLLLLLLSKDTLSSKRRPLRHWKEQKALLLFLVGMLLSACKSDVLWLTAFGRGAAAILTSIYIYIHETLMCPLYVFLISSLSRTQGNLARSCERVSEDYKV